LTGGVLLRDLTAGDLLIFFEHQLDPDATQMAAFPARAKDAFMEHWAKILGDETVITKTILFDGRVAGNVVSWQQSGEREVGYWIGKEYWGKGIATQALSEFLGHVTARPLYAHVAKHNVASIRVLEKCGFTISGEGAPGEEAEELVLILRANGGQGQSIPRRVKGASSEKDKGRIKEVRQLCSRRIRNLPVLRGRWDSSPLLTSRDEILRLS
jgi:RimJ/RimL family protein N-acetyltransferase